MCVFRCVVAKWQKNLGTVDSVLSCWQDVQKKWRTGIGCGCLFMHYVCLLMHCVCLFMHCVCLHMHCVCLLMHCGCLFIHWISKASLSG